MTNQEIICECVRIVLTSEGKLNSLFLIGKGGMGKTTCVINTFKALGYTQRELTAITTPSGSNKEFVYINSYSTILELVNFLYENRDKNIILDDFECLLNDKVALNVLKSALWDTDGKRTISYLTTSPRRIAPQQFEFNGKLFFNLNKLPKSNPLLDALLTRSLVYYDNYTYTQLLTLIETISRLPYKTLTDAQRGEIFIWLKNNTDETTEDLNIRTLIKLYDIYLSHPTDFEGISKLLVKRNEKLALVKLYIRECRTIGEAQRRFTEVTGSCRASFYGLKRKLE